MSPTLTELRSALSSFATSSHTFRVLFSIPPSSPSIAVPPLQTLFVLDSSFNPPTRAHLKMATSALRARPDPRPESQRLILLLATQNADKAPKPAPFEHRLVLLSRFAQDLHTHLSTPSTTTTYLPPIDIALTKHPYFHDKALAISRSYSTSSPPVEQIHLVGFDTLIRILDPRYYPPAHTLTPLVPFLANHRLRVTYRPSKDWGGRAEQDDYLRRLRDGERGEEGARKEWAERIDLVDDDGQEEDDEEMLSSTRAREAVRSGDQRLLKRLLTERVEDWVIKERLYTEEQVT